MKAVALDNAGGSLSRIGWGRGRGRALAFAYAALADFSSAVGAGGAEPGAWAPFRPPKAPPPASILGFGSGAPAELVVPGAGGREDGLGCCGWHARPAAGAPFCVAAALAPPRGTAYAP